MGEETMKKRIEVMAGLAILALMSGCGGGGSGDSNTDTNLPNAPSANQPGATDSSPVTGAPNSGSSTATIAGFWNFSSTDGSDVVYELITSEGMITYYDYDQDSEGDGQNCYYVQTDSFTAVGNNEYNFNGFILNMRKSGDNLLVSYPGGGQASVPPVVGISPVDLNSCL